MSEKPSYKELEQKITILEKQAAMYKKALKTIPIPIFYKDNKGEYLGCNPAFTKLIGIPHEILKGKTDKIFWPEDQAEIIYKKDLELIKNKKSQAHPIKISDRDGTLHSCTLFKDVFYDEKGRVKGIICALIDLSEQKRKEREFQNFSVIIEQAAEEVIIADTDGNIQYVNPRFEENTGFSMNEVLGENPRILKSGVHDRLFYQNLWQTLSEKKIWKGKIINKSKSGRQIIHDATITPILDPTTYEITAFVSVRRDITEQEKIEKQLRQTCKMEAIGTLAGGIAHDFNNILAGVMGYTELVIEDLVDIKCSSGTMERLENVIQSASRAKNLIKQILTFSRSDSEGHQPINAGLLIKEVETLLRASFPPTIEITLSLKSNAIVMADPVNIHQILMNICTNAKDAMEKTGGVLNISTTDEILNEKDLTAYKDVKPGNFFLISIKDTGIGIDKDIINKIMEPFFTTKAQNDGTGLGLFVVHGIVKNLGGFINVTSRINVGSKFDIYLPVCNKTPNEYDLSVEDEIIGGKESILCIDDEPMLNTIYKDSLSYLGYKVTTFDNSCHALEFFNKNNDDCDLVIADIAMPEITGDVLVQKMRVIKPELPVILCTGAGNGIKTHMDKQIIKKRKINALLFKPVRLKRLASVIRNVLDGKTEWQIF